MKNRTTIAVDLSKDVFEIAVEREGRIVERRRLGRRQMLGYFSACPRATVVMEACGSAHFWGRKIQGFGHTVRLLPPQHVEPYRIGGKTDRRDVEAILEANRRKRIVPVPVKTVEQQTVASLHPVRAALLKTRTARLNLVRGLLREFGVTIGMGPSKVGPGLMEALSDPDGAVPEALGGVLLVVMKEVEGLQESIDEVEKRLKALSKQMPLVERLETIPGVGLLNATALTTMVGDYGRFPSGRRFSGWLGVTPSERSSGKRRWLGSISKAGDTYLRTLLIGGARSLLLAAHRTKRPDRLHQWALEVERRRGRNRAAVALANKLGRIVWAVATRGAAYQARLPEPPAGQATPA